MIELISRESPLGNTQDDSMHTEIPRYGDNRAIIGMPPRAIALSNSERMEASCDARWFYRYALNLGYPESKAIRIGSMWAEWKGELNEWWIDKDCSPYPDHAPIYCAWCSDIEWSKGCGRCDFTKLGVITRIFNQRHTLSEEQKEEAVEAFETVLRMAQGYLIRRGRVPPEGIRPLRVEVMIAAPIISPNTGKVLQCHVPLVKLGKTYRLARPGEKAKLRRWPVYQLGKLDAVLLDIETKMLWVGEDKSSATPSVVFDGLTVDPQTAGYEHLLTHACSIGAFGQDLQQRAQEGKKVVAGYRYEVSLASRQRDPDVLKSGKLSQRKIKTIPSWRYEETIEREGLYQGEYAEHVSWLKAEVDQRFYQVEVGSVGSRDIERYRLELFSVAQKHMQMRRDAWRTSVEDMPVYFPRTPVCKRGFGCGFKGICAAGATSMDGFEEKEGQVWA